MATLKTIQLPIHWEVLGFPEVPQVGPTTLIEGDPAWGWDTPAPDLGIPVVAPPVGVEREGWGLDHVVLLVPDLEGAINTLHPVGAPRLRTTVKGRPAAFYRVGPLLEVIESPVRSSSLFGIALVTTRSLQTTAREWRALGLDVDDPQPALQGGRHIFIVRGLDAGLAVMSPDGPKAG